jgi:hypothetical protein
MGKLSPDSHLNEEGSNAQVVSERPYQDAASPFVEAEVGRAARKERRRWARQVV